MSVQKKVKERTEKIRISPVNCTDKKTGKLIARYEFGLLSNEEKNRFEMHVLHCDSCMRDLYLFAPALSLLRKESAVVKSAIEETSCKKSKKFKTRFISKPAFALGTACLLLFLFITAWLVTPLPPDYSEMADIQPVKYEPFEFRLRAEQEPEWRQWFDKGMKFYKKEEYEQALDALLKSYHKNKEYVRTQYYLGTCFLLLRQPDSSIQYLSGLSDTADSESIHWLLGNAYLLKTQAEKAMQEFDKVVKLDGPHKEQAIQLSKTLHSQLQRPILVKKFQALKEYLVNSLKEEQE